MHTRNNFTRNIDLNVWMNPDEAETFPYRDGAEQKLLKLMLEGEDRSLYADRFHPYKSWAEEYHLSPERINVLQPIVDRLKPGTKVLELGSGCGAITRYLGELGCEVTAVEGSLSRAKVAGARCADLPNVSVYCSNFQDIDFTDESFDIITLIGVFEYSALYWKGETPFRDCLKFIDQHSSDESIFFMAIENQLGLKYLNGYGEDHVNIPYFGVNNLYQVGKNTAETFTKSRLSEMVLSATGLSNLKFYYPFPDYKMPSVILTEAAFGLPELQVHQIISGTKSRDYGSDRQGAFNEPSVFELLGEEGIASSFSHSFILLASRSQLPVVSWLAKIVSNRRRPQFVCETTIRRENGQLVVEKQPVRESGSIVEGVAVNFSPTPSQPFFFGELLQSKWQRLLYLPRGEAWNVLSAEIHQWILYLKQNKDDHGNLPSEWYDATPRNIIENDGAYHLLDMEWQLTQPLPFQWVIIRGLLTFFTAIHRSKWVTKIPHRTLKGLIAEAMMAADVPLTGELLRQTWQLDASIQDEIRPGQDSRKIYQRAKRFTTASLVPSRIYFRFLEIVDRIVPRMIQKFRSK